MLKAAPPKPPKPSRLSSQQKAASGCNPGLPRVVESDEKDNNTLFARIADQLRIAGQEEWALRPRTYKVLSRMNATTLMDDFVSADLFDIALPYQRNFLPKSLSAEHKDAFLANQHTVLSKQAKDIEGGPKAPHANLAISADTYLELIAYLGRGAHGVVDKVRSNLSKRIYARKTLLLANVDFEPSALKNLNTEIVLMKRLRHHHLIRYVGSYTDPEKVGFLMTPVADCDLRAFLGQSSFCADDLKCIREAFGCLCAALVYLQEQRCRHKDIKPGNILVKAGKVYITDFGIANDWSDKTRSTTVGDVLSFSTPYAAPEVLNFQSRNTASDMWSLGCVYLDMVTVLNGESLEAKNGFFEVTGTGAPGPTNQEACKAWMKRLRSTCDSKPLDWIHGLLRTNPKSRISSHVLMENILECDDKNQYYGDCCDTEISHTEDQLSDAKEANSADVAGDKKALGVRTLDNRLCEGAKNGDLTAVKRWLSKLLQAISKDKRSPYTFQTLAFHSAANAGHLDVIKELCLSGLHPNVVAPAWANRSALDVAIHTEHEIIAQHLVNCGRRFRKDGLGLTKHLRATVERGMLGATRTLLDNGAPVNAVFGEGKNTLFEMAVWRDRLAVLQLLIERGAEVVVKDDEGWRALNWAIRRQLVHIITLLLDHITAVDHQKKKQACQWALIYAAAQENAMALEMILSQGVVDLSWKEPCQGWTALHQAVQSRRADVAEILLKNKADPEVEDHVSRTPLLIAVHNRDEKMVALLLRFGASAHSQRPRGPNAFLHSLDLHELKIAQSLVDHGAKLDAPNNEGISAVHLAVEKGDMTVLEFLVKNGANLDTQSYRKLTPLAIAVHNRDENMVEVLLRAGASIEYPGAKDSTAFRQALGSHELQIAQKLVDYGAEVDFMTDSGMSSVSLAARAGEVDTLRLLLDNGADINGRRNGNNLTPLMAAARESQLETLHVLLDRGANHSAQLTADGLTALHFAVFFGGPEAVGLLIAYGAKQCPSQEGFPIDVALREEKYEAAVLLREYSTFETPPNPLTAPVWRPFCDPALCPPLTKTPPDEACPRHPDIHFKPIARPGTPTEYYPVRTAHNPTPTTIPEQNQPAHPATSPSARPMAPLDTQRSTPQRMHPHDRRHEPAPYYSTTPYPGHFGQRTPASVTSPSSQSTTSPDGSRRASPRMPR